MKLVIILASFYKKNMYSCLYKCEIVWFLKVEQCANGNFLERSQLIKYIQ